jgi:hypothetical protein
MNLSSCNTTRTLSASFYGHYAELSALTVNECTFKCVSDPICAAACFTVPFQCRLYKFGFDKVAKGPCLSKYIKPEVRAEMAYNAKLLDNGRGSSVKKNFRLFNHYKSLSTLTPSSCFKLCQASVECGGATFTIDTKLRNNCYMCYPGKFTDSTQQSVQDSKIEYWTSYLKTPVTAVAKTINVCLHARKYESYKNPKKNTILTVFRIKCSPTKRKNLAKRKL